MSLPNSWQFARLIALQPDVQPAQFTIKPDVCTIGRVPTCHVVIARKIVSRLHAKIQRDEGARYILYDMESANGTFVNGQRLREPYLLRDGDEVGLGAAEPLIRFEDSEATATVTARLRYDALKMKFYLDKQPVELTPGQFRLLQHLARHAGEVCTRASCAEVLWDREYDPVMDAEALNRAISNLRTQLSKIAPDQEFIVTYRGAGYMLNI